MELDLIIAGGTVVTDTSVRDLDLGVRDGKVAVMAERGALDQVECRRVPAKGLLVLPGGVDPHCHYNLGHNRSGDVRNESQEHSWASAFGGTTTVLDFAVQEGSDTLRQALDSKHAEASGKMAVDYGFHLIVTRDVGFELMEEIPEIIHGGVPTIKTFMTYDWMVDDGHRFGIMQKVAEAGGMSMVHAEDDSLAKWRREQHLREGKKNGAYISEVRNDLVEEAAVRRAILLARRTGSPLYVLHVAARSAAQAIGEARRQGAAVFGETLASYLSFTSQDLWNSEDVVIGADKAYSQKGLLWSSFPPVKTEDDQAGLWSALESRDLQVVSSDHSAFSVTDRYENMGTTLEDELLQGGNSSVELRLPVLYHLGVIGRGMDLRDFVSLAATNAAKLMGLYPKKGALQVGSDADVVLFDPQETWTVRHDGLHMSPEYNCWDGWELTGRVKSVFLRGHELVRDGNYVGPKDAGQFVERKIQAHDLASFVRV